MLTKDYVDVQKWYYNSLKFTSLLHRGSSTISWSHKGFSRSLFSCFGLGRSTRKYAMVSHQCAQLSLSVVPIGKRSNQQIPLLLHADWNSFRNSFNSGPPVLKPGASWQFPDSPKALCTLLYMFLLFTFGFFNFSFLQLWQILAAGKLGLQSRSWCRAWLPEPGAVRSKVA